jgi:hypothetical protein
MYRQQSHTSKRKKCYYLKTRNMQSVPLPTCVGQRTAKILQLKNTTDCKIKQQKKRIILKKLKLIHMALD